MAARPTKVWNVAQTAHFFRNYRRSGVFRRAGYAVSGPLQQAKSAMPRVAPQRAARATRGRRQLEGRDPASIDRVPAAQRRAGTVGEIIG